MEKKKILIIEDEEKIARVLELELTYEGYEAIKVMDGLDGLRLIREQEWDLVLLDIMLPGMSGIDILGRIRNSGQEVPIILLTAKDSLDDKVTGLDLGANDYITKPFQIEELFARIRAVLRTSGNSEHEAGDWLTFSDLRLSDTTREVYRGEDLIDLTPREFDLLQYLLENKRHVLNREQILNSVWGYDYYGDTNVVDVYIRYLRNKIDKPYGRPLIHTVRGVGYVLKEIP